MSHRRDKEHGKILKRSRCGNTEMDRGLIVRTPTQSRTITGRRKRSFTKLKQESKTHHMRLK
jgi:hypothetical protein